MVSCCGSGMERFGKEKAAYSGDKKRADSPSAEGEVGHGGKPHVERGKDDGDRHAGEENLS